MPFAKQHPHLRCGAVDVVGQALHHDGHLVGGEAFVNHMLKVHGLTGQTRTLFDGAVQGFFGHGNFARLLHDQAQARVASRVGAVARRDHDVLGQFPECPAPCVGCQFLAFCFPLRAHGVAFLVL